MSRTKIPGYALIIFLLLSSVAFSQTGEMKEHKVVKKDTLWDIAKAELNDPFLWPKIWKENTWIANPDLIYPGQVIKIPVYLISKEKRGAEAASKTETSLKESVAETQSPAQEPQKPAAASKEPAKEDVKKEAAPIKPKPLVKLSLLMASGYMTDKIPGVGRVGESNSTQTIFGQDDLVYITLDRTAQLGDKFYAIKSSGPVEHPITGKDIGYVITNSGILEIVKIIDGKILAKVTKSFREIRKGDSLDLYYDMEPPLTKTPFRSPDINGMIVAVANDAVLQAMLDIIYIDKGCKDGIEAGDVFRTYKIDAKAFPNSLIQVISCRDHTATAIIKKSIASVPVTPGNVFAALDKN